MKIFLIIISIVNILVLLLFAGAMLGLSMFSSSSAADSAIGLFILGLLICVITPWILYRFLQHKKAGIKTAISVCAVVISLIPVVFWGYIQASNSYEELPLRNPDTDMMAPPEEY